METSSGEVIKNEQLYKRRLISIIRIKNTPLIGYFIPFKLNYSDMVVGLGEIRSLSLVNSKY